MLVDKEKILNLSGLLFLFFGIGAIINTIVFLEDGLAPILWFCYSAMILISIGIFRRDSFLILAQLNILGLPLLFWNFDFFYHLIFGRSYLGIVDYFFTPGNLFGKIISLQHLITIPLVILAIYFLGLKRKDSWKLSFYEITFFFLLSRIFTGVSENVNCVYENCANFTFGLPHILEWFLANVVMILIVNYLVVFVLYKKKEKSSGKKIKKK
jgi:hypothetical protein